MNRPSNRKTLIDQLNFFNRNIAILIMSVLLFTAISGCEARSLVISHASTDTATDKYEAKTITSPPVIADTQKKSTSLPTIATVTPSSLKTTHTVPLEVSNSWDGYLALIIQDKTRKSIAAPNLPHLCLALPDKQDLQCPLQNAVTYPTVTWSADGQNLIFSPLTEKNRVFTLHKMNLPAGQIEEMSLAYSSPMTVLANMDDPSWSIEQDKILFSWASSGEAKIFSMQPNGLVEYLLDGYFAVWLDHGQAIAYLRLKKDEDTNKTFNYGEIYRYEIHNQEDTLLVEDQTVHFLASSPDGKKLAYVTLGMPDIIHIINSDGSNPVNLRMKDAGFFNWDIDGESLIVAKDCQIYRASLTGEISSPFPLPEDYCYLYGSIQSKQDAN